MTPDFYSRIQLLPEFTEEVMVGLRNKRVLVIGAGGLGCPVLQCLNGIGIGEIGILDGDGISSSNLARQFLYDSNDIGKNKAEIAARKLTQTGSATRYKAISSNLTPENALSSIYGFDVVLDCTDNFATRYLINDACFLLEIPLVYGAVHAFEGTLSVFHYRNGPTLRCLYPVEPKANEIGGCNVNGVLPTVTSLLGSLMAQEALKVVTGLGQPMSGILVSVDTLAFQVEKLAFKRGDTAGYPKHIIPSNYPSLCISDEIHELDVFELQEWMAKGKDFEIIDVREPWEVEICSLGGKNIPLGQIESFIFAIPSEKPVVFLCHHGVRSQMAFQKLNTIRPFAHFYNLIGGIDAWSVSIDIGVARY